jgi:tight adherence protein B
VTASIVAGASVAFALSLVAVSLALRDRSVVLGALVPPRSFSGRVPPVARRVLTGMVVAGAAALLGYALAGPIGVVAGAVGAIVARRVRDRRRRSAESAALEDGLADAVAVMAAAIRAGRSMTGALDEAAERVAPPLGPRLAALVDRVSLGVPVERAVLELARSIPGPDARLVAAVVGLHQRAGGDAPAVLDRVARTLRERRASAREVRSLTAQARLSGAILGFLPIGFFLFLAVTSRADVERALSSTTGLTAVVAGLTMQATAFVWIRRLLRVDR